MREGISTTIGGGLTWEKSDIDMRSEGFNPPIKTVKMSGPSLGWFAEGGAVVPAGRIVDLIGTLQFHHYTAPVNSPRAGVLQGTVPISYVTASAGLKINLFPRRYVS